MVDKKKYVVLDVETSGLDRSMDDLLSISFYRPDNKDCYTRFLPLGRWTKLRPEITAINGITEKMLKGKKHLTNKEWQEIVERFDLNNRTILHFGEIDYKFLEYYLLRKGMSGIEKLNFYNFKQRFITSSFSTGEYTKDNLCRGFGIKGITKVHSGANDCRLEWELFEKLNEQYVYCPYEYPNQVAIYGLGNDYLVPASYIASYPHFKKVLNLPKLKVLYDEVFSLKLSKKCDNKYDYIPQPSGFACEHLIVSMLDAKDVYDKNFTKENYKKLIPLGRFSYEPVIRDIPVIKNKDGTLTAVRKEDQARIDATNKQMLAIKKEIPPLIEFIKKEIFHNKQILSQELVVNKELRSFGFCDFSNEDAMLEMKFGSGYLHDFTWRGTRDEKKNRHKYQYYITSNGRPSFLLLGEYGEFKIVKLTFQTGDQVTHGGNDSIRRYVYQYSIDGKYLNKFPTIRKAAKSVKCHPNSISSCANGERKTSAGYRWSFKKVHQLPPIVYKERSRGSTSTKKVYQYSMEGLYIKTFNSMNDAANETKGNASKISMVCHGKRNHSAGYR